MADRDLSKSKPAPSPKTARRPAKRHALPAPAAALAKDGSLSEFSGYVQDSGEGRWTIEAAIEEAVPADVLSAALYARFRSRQEHTFGEKLLSAMRFGFGGHLEGKGPIDPQRKSAKSRAAPDAAE
jgi:6-phosphogluconate dehydrogenase